MLRVTNNQTSHYLKQEMKRVSNLKFAAIHRLISSARVSKDLEVIHTCSFFRNTESRFLFSSSQIRQLTNVTKEQKQSRNDEEQNIRKNVDFDSDEGRNSNVSFFTLSKETRDQLRAINTQARSTPNMITIARICSTPFLCNLVISERYQLAVAGCVIAGFSDWLDGYIAKNYNQITVFGTYLDPFADKIFINSIAMSLSYVDILPLWSVALWVGRDIILIGSSFRFAAIAAKDRGHAIMDPFRTPLKIAPTMISKINTLLQFGTIGAALSLGAIGDVGYTLNLGYTTIGLVDASSYITGTTTILSGLSYIDGKSMIKSGNSKNNVN